MHVAISKANVHAVTALLELRDSDEGGNQKKPWQGLRHGKKLVPRRGGGSGEGGGCDTAGKAGRNNAMHAGILRGAGREVGRVR